MMEAVTGGGRNVLLLSARALTPRVTKNRLPPRSTWHLVWIRSMVLHHRVKNYSAVLENTVVATGLPWCDVNVRFQ
jgi:hypothetical protein